MYAKTYRGFRGRWKQVPGELVAHGKPSETILSKQSFGKLLSFAVSSEPLGYLLSCRYNNFSLRELYSTGSKDKLLSVIDLMRFFHATWLGLGNINFGLTTDRLMINILQIEFIEHWLKTIPEMDLLSTPEDALSIPTGGIIFPSWFMRYPLPSGPGNGIANILPVSLFHHRPQPSYTAWASTEPVAHQHRPGTNLEVGMHLLVVYLLLPLFDAN